MVTAGCDNKHSAPEKWFALPGRRHSGRPRQFAATDHRSDFRRKRDKTYHKKKNGVPDAMRFEADEEREESLVRHMAPPLEIVGCRVSALRSKV